MFDSLLTRRKMLGRCGMGFGAIQVQASRFQRLGDWSVACETIARGQGQSPIYRTTRYTIHMWGCQLWLGDRFNLDTKHPAQL